MSSAATNSHQRIRTEFPYKIEKLTQISIPIEDHIKLAATLWIPRSLTISEGCQSTHQEKFATVLEYLPYRKADWTSKRDEIRLKYIASFGYASLRVDIRGTGNSQGIFDDEYSEQELSDGLKILDWIENQSWSNGKVVIYGKSWGGFNGLQIGYLQPKNLSGIISAYSTDDRYSDDIHYYGGCLAAQEGGIDGDSNLFDVWKERLKNLIPLDYYWIRHQNRDRYWRHGSICEDYSKILCPVLLIGGFADLYNAPIFRLMNQLKCSKRAILGPWGHQWPDDAYPQPKIGFLQEVVQWLDYHIKGIDNGYGNKRLFSVFQLHPDTDELHPIVHKRKGQWIHFNSLPPYPTERVQRNDNPFNRNQNCSDKTIHYYLTFQCLTAELTSNDLNPKQISFLSPQETGTTSGNLLGWGNSNGPDHPTDQREDDGRSLCLDSLPLQQDYELFGFPTVKLNLSSDNKNGLICVRLCMIDQKTSSSILISRGVLNLTHYKSHEHPQHLNINHIYNVEITLSGVCVRLQAGSRLRLSLSTSYWPIVWPTSELSTLTIHFNDYSPCVLTLPCLTDEYVAVDDFDFPEVAAELGIKTLRDGAISRNRMVDEIQELVTLKINEDNGSVEYPDGIVWDETSESTYTIKKNDPQSARIEIKRDLKYYSQDRSFINTNIQTKSIMFTEKWPSTFQVMHTLNVHNSDQEVFKNEWKLIFPRIYS